MPALNNMTKLEPISLLLNKDSSGGHDSELLPTVVETFKPWPPSAIEVRGLSGSPEIYFWLDTRAPRDKSPSKTFDVEAILRSRGH